MSNLTKTDLTEQVYVNHPDLSRMQAAEAVEIFLTHAKAALIEGDELLLSGFGKFSVRDKRARRGRNPQTGNALLLDARSVVTFKCSGQLRKMVNGGAWGINDKP